VTFSLYEQTLFKGISCFFVLRVSCSLSSITVAEENEMKSKSSFTPRALRR
jgi:hypothetical protein